MWPMKINENTVDQKKYIETHKVALQYHIQLIEHINILKQKKSLSTIISIDYLNVIVL